MSKLFTCFFFHCVFSRNSDESAEVRLVCNDGSSISVWRSMQHETICQVTRIVTTWWVLPTLFCSLSLNGIFRERFRSFVLGSNVQCHHTFLEWVWLAALYFSGIETNQKQNLRGTTFSLDSMFPLSHFYVRHLFSKWQQCINFSWNIMLACTAYRRCWNFHPLSYATIMWLWLLAGFLWGLYFHDCDERMNFFNAGLSPYGVCRTYIVSEIRHDVPVPRTNLW